MVVFESPKLDAALKVVIGAQIFFAVYASPDSRAEKITAALADVIINNMLSLLIESDSVQ